MKKILFLSTMYPNPLRPGTKVCHSFTTEWQKMGYEVLVVHYRSMFPVIYTIAAKIFPKLALKYIGNYVEMDRNLNVLEYNRDGIPVYSIPIFKCLPHGKYSKWEIIKQISKLKDIMNSRDFVPDAIIGHFYNPQLEIIARLKESYPNVPTCVTFHEPSMEVIRKVWPKTYKKLLKSIDVFGFRSLTIKRSFEREYGTEFKGFHCCSGTPQIYLDKPSKNERCFTDGPIHSFIYVGQTIKRKFPKETLEGVHMAKGKDDFSMTYVGSKDLGYPETVEYAKQHILENMVTFTGKTPREDIITHYDKSDCFILISKAEVFGLVYLEAMSRGCITIASKREGMEGIIENGVNGFLCEAGNADELSSIIKHIDSLSAKEKQAICDKAKETARRLSEHNVAKIYLDNVFNN